MVAFYQVNYDGAPNANHALFKAANGLGDAGAMRLVATGVPQISLLGQVLYPIAKADVAKYERFKRNTEVQQVDARLREFVLVGEDFGGVKIDVPKDVEILKIEDCGFEFVRIADIVNRSKYRNQSRMATIKVCGAIYAALNAKVRTEDNPVVLFVEA